MTLAQMLDQVEDACKRAEREGKDRDLVIALRAIYLMLQEKVREK